MKPGWPPKSHKKNIKQKVKGAGNRAAAMKKGLIENSRTGTQNIKGEQGRWAGGQVYTVGRLAGSLLGQIQTTGQATGGGDYRQTKAGNLKGKNAACHGGVGTY